MSRLFAAALWALAVFGAHPGLAHEGHDHGTEAPVPAHVGPRAEAASPTFELVAIPRGHDLVLYLDAFASNAPVAGADIDVETPDGFVEAKAQEDGSYRLAAPWLAAGCHHDLAVTVKADGIEETLTLDLDLPEAGQAMPAAGAAEPSALLTELRNHLGHQGLVGAVAGGFLLGLATIALMRSRRALPALAVLALTLTLLVGGAAIAHEGHDEPPPPVNGAALIEPTATVFEQARRLPDGTVFVPKATQHLLAVRTGVTAEAAYRRTIELPGRVIADPNASGVVQSSVGGRLSPPPGGFPNLGAQVRRGDVLATVTPPVQAVDASDMRQTQGDLDQQIAIVARRVARYEKLAPSGAIAKTALDDAQAELTGLKDRRSALDTLRRVPEDLIAPVDGVVAERAATAGQMAAPGTMVFRIVDPGKLYVEALSFEALEPGATATGRLPDGRTLTLAYRGAGLADRAQAVPVQFAITGGADGVRLGQFVTVLAPTGGTATGLALPRASVIRSEGGAVVYEHVSAERFAPLAVKVEPLDAERVLVAGGVAAGRRIVTQGAELLDQVR
ncbi:HlyD family efflux transporter periplasmic adaptor subunit [Methylobacterium sp. WL9]|uniref:efflux RND transporter periplasmic adaptor subunit n=1 Tax=Methylobacterium sp. WL9 TaxID=2603898 RepID=UPI0011C7DC45|nr:HlyD family efflux transporter periplasmic adaptor subunit [Methylobacterium sp. WL9]TXN24864.1 HlyD family efflux transporter periplasmic adaptor subunit [Methylobacterium sp. WL9]